MRGVTAHAGARRPTRGRGAPKHQQIELPFASRANSEWPCVGISKLMSPSAPDVRECPISRPRSQYIER